MTTYIDDIDAPKVCVTVMRTARKSHRCCECRREIARGQRYEFTSGIWDRRPDSFKTCEACLILREHVLAETDSMCWEFGRLLDDASESARESVSELRN